MKRAKRSKPGNVAAKTARFVCAKIGHARPTKDAVFPRCPRCGTPLR